ncbi:hypothetical protein [Rhodoferax sp. GW822-FHT02A01]|uniref:hypothetical protein n=1 Tax=Rhodoferax sp. GW822-FHT02A01 TaxID=3141537 RepID=UPI00315CD128
MSNAQTLNRATIFSSGVIVRVARPGETDEQTEKWQSRVLKRIGRRSIVLPSQDAFDAFMARRRDMEEQEKGYEAYEKLVNGVMAKYFAGRLAERSHAHTACACSLARH